MSQAMLSAGATHYELAGDAARPLLVLVHGISIPLWNWDYLAPALVQAGFRVLRYDMFGRGQSACPRCAYDRALLLRQLSELLDALHLTAPVHLAGFSFGGAVAANFTAAYPARVARLALIAPFARMAQPDRRRLARVPVLGELLMRFALRAELQARAARLLRSSADPERYNQAFAEQIARPQFQRAFLSLMRSDALDDYGAVYAAVAASGVPSALLWGTQDIDIPRDSIDYTRGKLRPQLYQEVEGADHGSILQPAQRLDHRLAGIFSARDNA